MAAVQCGRGWELHLGDCLKLLGSLPVTDHAIFDPPYEVEAHTKARRALKDATQKRGGVNIGEVRRTDQPLVIDFGAITDRDRRRAARLIATRTRGWNTGLR